jgi:hypothetical protein
MYQLGHISQKRNRLYLRSGAYDRTLDPDHIHSLLMWLQDHLPSFTGLMCFSLYNRPHPTRFCRPCLDPSALIGIVDSLPRSLRCLELYSFGGDELAGSTPQHHLCEAVSKSLHRLEHVRLGLTLLCPAILPLHVPIVSRLRTFDINLHSPSFQIVGPPCCSGPHGDRVAESPYGRPNNIDLLLPALTQLSKQGALSRFQVLQSRPSMMTEVGSSINKHDILAQTTTVCPFMHIYSHSNSSFYVIELRLPGSPLSDKHGDHNGEARSLPQRESDQSRLWRRGCYVFASVEGDTWVQTAHGSRFPRESRLRAGFETFDEWAEHRLTRSQLHELGVTIDDIPLWKAEAKAKRSLGLASVTPELGEVQRPAFEPGYLHDECDIRCSPPECSLCLAYWIARRGPHFVES